MYYSNIPIEKYQFTIKYILNNSDITTLYNLIVLPELSYDINSLTLFYSRTGYSIIPYVSFLGGLFGFSDITSLDFLYTKVFIDASNGQLYFAKYINTGTYNLKIFYLYNNIYNYFDYKLIILPLIEYTISGVALDYNHLIYNTIEPIINPTKGEFFFADFSNNYPIEGLSINKKTGSIIINKINVGNYFIGIKYYLKDFCSSNRFIISILPSFRYSTICYIDYNINGFTYSDYPYVDPSGGIFNFVYPLNTNLLNKMNINNNGQITFYNSIDISTYFFNISYNYNNIISFATFNLIVKPLFIYNESELVILNKNNGMSSLPIIYPYGGTFNINSISINSLNSISGIINMNSNNGIFINSISGIFINSISGIFINSISGIFINSNNGIFINSNNGIIYINNNLPIGDYILTVSYEYKLIYSYFIYTIKILPNLSYPISNKNISYGYLDFSEKPTIDIENGFYFINPIYNDNGIFIDQSSGILQFNPTTYVNFYPITVYYSLLKIQGDFIIQKSKAIDETIYNLTVVPDLYYDTSNLIINYNEIFYTTKPYVNPINGIFSTNYGIIDIFGIINLSNLSVSSYIINTTYLYNNIINTYKINLIVKPYLIYQNIFEYIIYGLQKYSNNPIYSPNNGFFYTDSSNINIDSNGIIIFNPFQNIGKYNINIYYSVNNISNKINYQYYIIPYINYIESEYQIRGGINGQSNIPIINPLYGNFYIDNNIFNIDNSGSIIIKSNIPIGIYNINVNYTSEKKLASLKVGFYYLMEFSYTFVKLSKNVA
jgi:hypothetical protein